MDWASFADTLRLPVLGALALSGLLGAAVGMEREVQGKPAGLRTNMLICVGACLFTLISTAAIGDHPGDPARIAAQIVSGVGFIGAGTIMRTRGSVSGLTSAATIWVVAAIGMAVGVGWVFEAASATLFLLFVLGVLGRMEKYIERNLAVSRVAVKIRPDANSVERIEEIVREAGARVENVRTVESGDLVTVHLQIRGAQHSRNKAKLGVMRATGAWGVTDLDRQDAPEKSGEGGGDRG